MAHRPTLKLCVLVIQRKDNASFHNDEATFILGQFIIAHFAKKLLDLVRMQIDLPAQSTLT